MRNIATQLDKLSVIIAVIRIGKGLGENFDSYAYVPCVRDRQLSR